MADYDERSLHGGMPALPNVEDAVKSAFAAAWFGPLQPYFDDPQIEEIWTTSSKVFVAPRRRRRADNDDPVRR